jgi:arylsulfatase A-like enzyme
MEMASQDDLRRIISIYYGNCRYIDDQLGRVIDRLAQLGIEEDTIVLFTSDHGDFLGEHGMMHKACMFYDCLTKVPMIWRWPGSIPAGGTPGEFFEGVDVLPTALDLCALAAPMGVQGISFAGALRGKDTFPDREACFCEAGIEGAPLSMADLENLNLPESPFVATSRDWVSQPGYFGGRGKMVRTKRWKLSFYANGDGELYDMENDPWELQNLYGQPKHEGVVRELKDRLIRWTMETEDTLPSMGESSDR